jgi:hypothetical protein
VIRRLGMFIAWHLPLVRRAYWRIRRFLRLPALVIGTTDEDGEPGDEIHVYLGHVETRPRKGRR